MVYEMHPSRTDVRFGSKADMCSAKRHVRFTPESGHVRCTSRCPLSAKSGHQPFWRSLLGADPTAATTKMDYGVHCVLNISDH